MFFVIIFLRPHWMLLQVSNRKSIITGGNRSFRRDVTPALFSEQVVPVPKRSAIASRHRFSYRKDTLTTTPVVVCIHGVTVALSVDAEDCSAAAVVAAAVVVADRARASFVVVLPAVPSSATTRRPFAKSRRRGIKRRVMYNWRTE